MTVDIGFASNGDTIPQMHPARALHIYQHPFSLSPFQQLPSAKPGLEITPLWPLLLAHTGNMMQPHRPLQDAGKWPFSGLLTALKNLQLETSASSHSLAASFESVPTGT